MMKTQGAVACPIGEARKSTWLWVPLHQMKRIRRFTAHSAKSTPTCCNRVWVESHSGKKPCPLAITKAPGIPEPLVIRSSAQRMSNSLAQLSLRCL